MFEEKLVNGYIPLCFTWLIYSWIKQLILSEDNEFAYKIKAPMAMKNTRLQQLLEYLEDDPQDPFNRYAVATEYKSERPELALEMLMELIDLHPTYLPAYYHAGQLQIFFDQKDVAETTLAAGIELAKAQQNQLTLRELQNALNELLFDD
jgi:hypothetical protein